MPENYTIFDAAKFRPSKGINLIEASAGTGKTYAIGMIVLRAVVELELEIDRILIVTFTKSATEELKGRIRDRLVEAKGLLSGAMVPGDKEPDATLLDWVASIHDKEKAGIRLQLALFDMDRASIFTIHGFCQRMLVENALESQQLFSVELLADISRFRSQLVDDYWRDTIYQMDLLPCAILTEAYPTPEALYKTISLTGKSGCRIEPEVPILEESVAALQVSMEGMNCWWLEHGRVLKEKFVHAITGNCFKKSIYEDFERWFYGLGEFFKGRTFVVPSNLEFLLRTPLSLELNGNKFRGDVKKTQFLEDWTLPDDELAKLLHDFETLRLSFRGRLAVHLQNDLAAQLLGQGRMGFDDLITGLLNALRGAQGEVLRKQLGERFGAALIDEFQDTDSSQYEIFKNLFGGKEHYLYLIGDPKQSIYQFRGADIHTYFRAKKGSDNIYTLEKNYRSHPNLVEEVNRLFSARKNPFLLEEDVLGYHRVLPAKGELDSYLMRQGEYISAMVYCSLPLGQDEKNPRWTTGGAKTHFKNYVVAEIVDLLSKDGSVQIQGESTRSLRAKDIGILVRANKDAEEYRSALADVGIQAVLASRKSVFKAVECKNLITLIQAVYSPGNLVKLKAAMAITWFGLSGNQLQRIWDDEQELADWQEKFTDYNRLWQEQTFLVMMTRLLEKELVFVQLTSNRFAERAIANIHQLLELVQEQESTANMGPGQIQRWLLRMHLDEMNAEEGELLLESDEEAVQLVTMHSAKGLEYPVVFCPVLWHCSDYIKDEKHQVEGHSKAQRVVDLGSENFEAYKKAASRQQQAEDLRLLYVALTRAKLRCYVMWGDVKKRKPVVDAFDSALGYLLFPGGPCTNIQQAELLDELAEQFPVEHVRIARDVLPVQASTGDQKEALQSRPVSKRSLYTDWQMSSFSSLAALSDYEHELIGMGHAEKTLTAPDNQSETIAVTGLPAGPNFGNMIHDLLETFPFTQLCSPEKDVDVSNLSVQKGRRYGVETETEKIAKFLDAIVTTTLPPGFSLASLKEERCLKEMMFYYHLGHLSTAKINVILSEEPTVQPLNHKEMRGYLTGFVDLICEYGGKYYLIDYKTNLLGERMADYSQENLLAAMKSHNYGLQYWIYSLILHQHLKNLFSDYSYGTHFGGVMYLFLRGMSPDRPGSGVFSTLPDYNKLVALEKVIGEKDNG